MADTVYNNQQMGVVGTPSADLILQTLGKVYIKTGRNAKLLDTVVKEIVNSTNGGTSSAKIKIVGSLKELQDMEYPGDGIFIYNSANGVLYMSYDERYIPIADTAAAEGNYVKKTGDTMTGPLEIVTNEAPFIIASANLVRNLNAQYLEGKDSSAFAQKRLNEHIYGNWTFEGECTASNLWRFELNVRHLGDIVTSGSIGTPEFSSGFAGYGWRMDGSTNTLTVDYLVVRRAMLVYEMVINQIKATNGSLWVSNSSKVETSYKVHVLTLNILGNLLKSVLGGQLLGNAYYLPLIADNIKGRYTDSNGVRHISFKYIIYVNNVQELSQNPLFSISTLTNETLLSTDIEDYTSSLSGDNASYGINLRTNLRLHYIEDEGFIEDALIYKISNASLFELNGITTSTCAEIKPYYLFFAYAEDEYNALITAANSDFTSRGKAMYPTSRLYVVETDRELYPVFEPGDILRCQKMQEQSIKYYDALITSTAELRRFIVLKALSVFDMYSEITYNDDGSLESVVTEYNTTQYQRGDLTDEQDFSENTVDELLGDIAQGDDLIQIGNLYNTNRQGAIYLTSSDMLAPYIDVIGELNRPDYSVLYDVPTFKMHSLVKNGKLLKFYCVIALDGELSGENYVSGLYAGREQKTDLGFKEELPFSGNFTVDNLSSVSDPALVQTTPANVNFTVLDTGSGLLMADEENLLYFGQVIKSDFYFVEEIANPDCVVLQDDSGKYKHSYTKTTKVRLGNLDGIYNEMFGKKLPHGYGLYGENVYLTGEFVLSNGKSVASIGDDVTLAVGLMRDALDNDIAAITNNLSAVERFNAQLQSAGLRIVNNNIALWGDHILLYTTQAELNSGKPTMLLQDGKINTNLLEFRKLHGLSNLNGKDYTNITINERSEGEIVLYWADGSIMNAKVTKKLGDTITGCVEYFFRLGVCKTYEDLLLGNLEETVDANGDTVQVRVPWKEDGNCVKIIDYFNINRTVVVNAIQLEYLVGNSMHTVPLEGWANSLSNYGLIYSTYEAIIDAAYQLSGPYESAGYDTDTRYNFIKAMAIAADTANVYKASYYTLQTSGGKAYVKDIAGNDIDASNYIFSGMATIQLLEGAFNKGTTETDILRYLLPDGIYATEVTVKPGEEYGTSIFCVVNGKLLGSRCNLHWQYKAD